jgi:hypothetical protein
LQKGPGVEQLRKQGHRFAVVDLASQFEDAAGPFTDVAAVLPALDLVIGCDSALVHLAGAMGLPVWVLLSTVSDWRWLREREDSPWYPSLRLFRQRTVHDWGEVFQRVLEAVRDTSRDRQGARGCNAHALSGERLLKEWQLEGQARRWRAELRTCEQAGDFGPRFIAAARSLVQVEEERERLRQGAR